MALYKSTSFMVTLRKETGHVNVYDMANSECHYKALHVCTFLRNGRLYH